jgi:hypothetical protein
MGYLFLMLVLNAGNTTPKRGEAMEFTGSIAGLSANEIRGLGSIILNRTDVNFKNTAARVYYCGQETFLLPQPILKTIHPFPTHHGFGICGW